jgi:hypothetical protein
MSFFLIYGGGEGGEERIARTPGHVDWNIKKYNQQELN